ERLQAGIVDLVGSDQGAKDLARVLRLTGTLNTKPEDGAGVPDQVVMLDESRTYTLEDLEAAAKPFMPQAKPSERKSEAIRGILDPERKSLPEVAKLLWQLPKEYGEDRYLWLKVVMAVNVSLGNTPEAYELVDQWSRATANGNYDP